MRSLVSDRANSRLLMLQTGLSKRKIKEKYRRVSSAFAHWSALATESDRQQIRAMVGCIPDLYNPNSRTAGARYPGVGAGARTHNSRAHSPARRAVPGRSSCTQFWPCGRALARSTFQRAVPAGIPTRRRAFLGWAGLHPARRLRRRRENPDPALLGGGDCRCRQSPSTADCGRA